MLFLLFQNKTVENFNNKGCIIRTSILCHDKRRAITLFKGVHHWFDAFNIFLKIRINIKNAKEIFRNQRLNLYKEIKTISQSHLIRTKTNCECMNKKVNNYANIIYFLTSLQSMSQKLKKYSLMFG